MTLGLAPYLAFVKDTNYRTALCMHMLSYCSLKECQHTAIIFPNDFFLEPQTLHKIGAQKKIVNEILYVLKPQ